jgi:hypothetical protein
MESTNTTRPSHSDAASIDRTILLSWNFDSSTHATIRVIDMAVDVWIEVLECRSLRSWLVVAVSTWTIWGSIVGIEVRNALALTGWSGWHWCGR